MLRQRIGYSRSAQDDTPTRTEREDDHDPWQAIETTFVKRVQVALMSGLITISAGRYAYIGTNWWFIPGFFFQALHIFLSWWLGAHRSSQVWLAIMVLPSFVFTPLCLALPSDEFIDSHEKLQDGTATLAMFFCVGVGHGINLRSITWKVLGGAFFSGSRIAGELLLAWAHSYPSFTRFYLLYGHVPFVAGAIFGQLVTYTVVALISPLQASLREAERRNGELEQARQDALVREFKRSAITALGADACIHPHIDASSSSRSACTGDGPDHGSHHTSKVGVGGAGIFNAAVGVARRGGSATAEPTLTNVTVETSGDILGEGGFSTVYVGHCVGSKVAVKVPKAYSPSLELEAETLTQLRHPCICAFMGMMMHEGRLAIVLEHLEGGSLDRFLQLHAPAGERRAISFGLRMRMAREAASGIAFLHARGCVHRDVKPANILITADYHAKIADFGISQHKPSGTSHARSEWTNTAGVGTVRYMAPEVVLLNGDSAVSVLADRAQAAWCVLDNLSASNDLSAAKQEAGDQHDGGSVGHLELPNTRYGTPSDVYSFGLVRAAPLPLPPSIRPKCSLGLASCSSLISRTLRTCRVLFPQTRQVLHEIMYQQQVMEGLSPGQFMYNFIFLRKRPPLPPPPICRSGDAQGNSSRRQSFGGDVEPHEEHSLMVEILISSCWQHSADSRPSMMSAVESLMSIESSSFLALPGEGKAKARWRGFGLKSLSLKRSHSWRLLAS